MTKIKSAEKTSSTIERELFLQQMQTAINSSKEISSKRNKLALRVAMNLFDCQKHLEEFKERQKNLSALYAKDEDVKEYSEKKSELISKYQDKDADGTPLYTRQTGEPLIVSKLAEFNKEMKSLKSDYAEADKKIKEMEEELNERYKNKITVTINPINPEWIKDMSEKVIGDFAFMFPKTLSAKQLPASVPASEVIKIMEFCEIEEGEED